MSIRAGLVGATGAVGEIFVELLSTSSLDVTELRPFASSRSRGQSLRFRGQSCEIQELGPGCFDHLDLVFFSSGADLALEWAPEALKSGAMVIDNSSAFRESHLLIVPEVNAHLLPKRSEPQIIANPNCSTIQLVVALKPLMKLGLKAVQVSTYQAVSGAGKPAVQELLTQSKIELSKQGSLKHSEKSAFSRSIGFNCVPQIGAFESNGLCEEEQKMNFETKKILEAPQLKVSPFTVRVPVVNGHSETVWARFGSEVSKNQIEEALSNQEGLEFLENTDFSTAYDQSGELPVSLGRLHQDPDDPEVWRFWIVADNLLKGAALNGLQIAEIIYG